jgi:hypothetical protein
MGGPWTGEIGMRRWLDYPNIIVPGIMTILISILIIIYVLMNTPSD